MMSAGHSLTDEPHGDALNVFAPEGRLVRDGAPDGLLAGHSFALKDLIDLAGVPTGAGNPDWRRTQPIPARTAPVAMRLLEAGARLVGKVMTDELAWDLDGRNCHYGTPVNAAAPGRLPGGSSSGSAAATAAGLCDFAIGTDTGGSVRLPASFCGLYGIRPTHGRVPSEGVVPLAASFDTVGWFARDPGLFAAVGRVLLGVPVEPVTTERFLIADDLFALVYPDARAALQPVLDRLADRGVRIEYVVVAGDALSEWREAFRTIQSHEAWVQHRDWIGRVDPDFGTDIREQLEAGSHLEPDRVAAAATTRADVRLRMEALVPPGSILILPTVPGIAPPIDVSDEEDDAFRDRAHAMLCLSGLSGMPQIAMPLAQLDDCPLGLSALAAQGQDEALLALAVQLALPA